MFEPTIRRLRAKSKYDVDGDVHYFNGISAAQCGALKICMGHYVLAPKGTVPAHRHDDHECGLFVVAGRFAVWTGSQLEDDVDLEPGDFLFIPAGAPHRLFNPSRATSAVAVIARSSPAEPESRSDLLSLERRLVRLAEQVRAKPTEA